MTVTENRCVDCGLPCKGASCPNRRIRVCYCDECDEEIPYNQIYDVDGQELCEDCLKKMFLRE